MKTVLVRLMRKLELDSHNFDSERELLSSASEEVFGALYFRLFDGFRYFAHFLVIA